MKHRALNAATFVVVAGSLIACVAIANHMRRQSFTERQMESAEMVYQPPRQSEQALVENQTPEANEADSDSLFGEAPNDVQKSPTLNDLWIEFCTVSVPEVEKIYLQIGDQVESQTEQLLVKLIRNAKNSSFVEDVQSFQSSWDSVFAKDQHTQWIKTTFERNVFSEQDIELVLSHQLKQLHSTLSDCDDQLLMKLSIDASYDGRNILTPQVKMKALAPKFSGVLNRVQSKVVDVTTEAVVSTVSGLVAGDVAYSIASDSLAYDQHGNFNLAGEVISQLIGFGAGIAAEAATESVFDAKGSLRKAVNDGIDDLGQVLLSKDDSVACWRTAIHDLTANHLDGVLGCVVESIGIDKDFAFQELAKVRVKVKGVAK